MAHKKNKTSKKGELETQNSQLFLFFVTLFISSIISANTIAVKIFSIYGIFLPAGVIIFPVSYILGDVLTEVYGFKKTRVVIWLGFFANFLFVLSIIIARNLPSAPIWTDQESFNRILGYTPKLLVASITGYLFGSFANSIVLSKIKILTKGHMLWIRTIGSTIVGEGLDSLVFITIAFFGNIPNMILLKMILNQWIFKTLYEAIVTPITYFIVSHVKRIEKIDTYDYKTNYNPFKLVSH